MVSSRNFFMQTCFLVGLLWLVVLLSGTALGQSRFGKELPEKTEQNSSRTNTSTSSRYTLKEHTQRFGVQVDETKAQAIRRRPARRSSHRPEKMEPAGSVESVVSKADDLVKAGEFENAIDLYHKAISTKPQMASAYLGLGYIYAQ